MFVRLQLGLATGMREAVRWNTQNGWRSMPSAARLRSPPWEKKPKDRHGAASRVVKDVKTNRHGERVRGILV